MERSLLRAEEDSERAGKTKRLKELRAQAMRDGRGSEAAMLFALEDKDAFNATFPERSSADAINALRMQEIQNERAQRDAEGLGYLNANRQNQEVLSGYGSILSRNPRMTPGQIGYALMQQGGKTATESQREAGAAAAQKRASGGGLADFLGGGDADGEGLDAELFNQNEAYRKWVMAGGPQGGRK
jgi:hypothetical protein